MHTYACQLQVPVVNRYSTLSLSLFLSLTLSELRHTKLFIILLFNFYQLIKKLKYSKENRKKEKQIYVN